MTSTDTKLLEARLASRDSAIGGSSVSQCATRMQQFYKLLQESDDDKAVAVALENFSRGLLLYALEMDKAEQTYRMCDREIEEYLSMEKEIENKINQTEQSIQQLSVELMEQKALRRHREECENLAKLVISVPSCASTEKEINQLREECDHLRKIIAAKEVQEDTRKKQFTLIMQAISDLQRSIAEEETTQAMLTQLQQQLGAGDEEENEDDNDEGDEDASRDKRAARGEQINQPPAKKARTDGDDESGTVTGGDDEDDAASSTIPSAPSRNTSIDVEVPDGDRASVLSPEGGSSRSSSPRPPPPPPPAGRPVVSQSPSPSALSMHKKIQMISEPEEGEEEEGTGGNMDTTK